MNANQFLRWLKKRGVETEAHKGGSGHLTLVRGDKTTQMPMHGGRKQLKKGLMAGIRKDLGIEE